MPYENLQELPKNIKDMLPRHAQEIYLSAYNNAWKEYRHAEDRRGDDDRESVAHKVAWSAVRQKYHKDDGHWVKNDD